MLLAPSWPAGLCWATNRSPLAHSFPVHAWFDQSVSSCSNDRVTGAEGRNSPRYAGFILRVGLAAAHWVFWPTLAACQQRLLKVDRKLTLRSSRCSFICLRTSM